MFIFPFDTLPYYQNYAFRERFFTEDECDRALAQLRTAPMQDVVLQKDESTGSPGDLSRSRAGAIALSKENQWIYHRLAAAVIECNRAMYNFQISGFVETLQLEQFDVGHFHDWRQDFGFREHSIRKLNVVVNLTDGMQYEGGDVEFFSTRGTLRAVRSRGSLLIFPSFVASRVSSVVKGSRQAIAGWVAGPPFK